MEYIHIPGKENVLADGMSRMRCTQEEFGEGKMAEEVNEVLIIEKEEAVEMWKEWLEDPWYGEVVNYKLFGDFESYRDADVKALTAHRRRFVRLKSKPYRLLETQPSNHYTTKPPNRWVFVERNGKESFCARAVEVESILYQSHDCHGHFAAGVLLRTLVGRYYWPTRAKDVNMYYVTCPSCQMVGPLKPSVSQLAIVHL